MSWLVVLLAAPLASFGEEPGNARRGTADRPSRSALLGLAGAALGILREDAEGQRTLRESFRTAARTLRTGELLTDFHTFQSLPSGKEPVATRADALARRDRIETSITRRDYRSDALWQVAFGPGGSIGLDALRTAFEKPRFALWAGRKSCPLGPLAPRIVDGDDLEAAFGAHGEWLAAAGLYRGWARALEGREVSTIACDAYPHAGRNEPGAIRRRNDEPGDRVRWHFSPRSERVYRLRPRETPAGGAG